MIPSLPKFRPTTAGSEDMEGPQKVSELMHNRCWNVTMLNNLFSPWEVEAIKRIPLPHAEMEDKWVWHYTKHGNFTVKSAYNHAMEEKKTQRHLLVVWVGVSGSSCGIHIYLLSSKLSDGGCFIMALQLRLTW